MSDDRLTQARAEAERRQTAKHWRMWEDEGEHLSYPWSMGFLAGFREAVEWADANPQPRTITLAQSEAILEAGRTGTYEDHEAALRAAGIEAEDDDE